MNILCSVGVLSATELFRTFIEGVFYIGKGTKARPYAHLYQALDQQVCM